MVYKNRKKKHELTNVLSFHNYNIHHYFLMVYFLLPFQPTTSIHWILLYSISSPPSQHHQDSWIPFFFFFDLKSYYKTIFAFPSKLFYFSIFLEEFLYIMLILFQRVSCDVDPFFIPFRGSRSRRWIWRRARWWHFLYLIYI